MALTFPASPCRVHTECGTLSQLRTTWNPNPHLLPLHHSAFRICPKSVHCPTHGSGDHSDIAAAADIAGFILQYCAESHCTQFIFWNQISPRTTLHFSDPCVHKTKNATKNFFQMKPINTTPFSHQANQSSYMSNYFLVL